MRNLMLTLALVLAVSPLWAQTAVQRALDASRAVTAHDHATSEQAGEAMHDGDHGGDHAGHQDHGMTAPVDEGVPVPTATGSPAGEHAGHGEQGTEAVHVHPVADPAESADIGVTEKLGQFVAADARFLDESGRALTIGQVVDKPTIFVPVYFSCPNVCAIIQSSLTQVLPDVKLTPGEDFQVISVSFDETDTPELAANQKRNYLAAMDFKYPENGWRFLTGDAANIRRFTDSLGFGFRRQGKDFLHPVAVMAVSPKGKIVRYLYGTRPLAFDLTMAATEAGREQVGLSVKRVLAYCFSYDPEGKRYVFNFMKITATGILVMLGVLLVSLMLAGRRKRTPRN